MLDYFLHSKDFWVKVWANLVAFLSSKKALTLDNVKAFVQQQYAVAQVDTGKVAATEGACSAVAAGAVAEGPTAYTEVWSVYDIQHFVNVEALDESIVPAAEADADKYTHAFRVATSDLSMPLLNCLLAFVEME
eukprot:5940307-Alexandrium_andersonii.AAC.1